MADTLRPLDTTPTLSPPLIFHCQACRAPVAVGGGGGAEVRNAPPSSAPPAPVDGSFILLDEARRLRGDRMGVRICVCVVCAGGVRASRKQNRRRNLITHPSPPATGTNPPLRLDESFVVLAGAPAILRPARATLTTPSPARALAAAAAASTAAAPVPHTPLDAWFAAAAAAFELASREAGVDAPLCGECAGRVGAELEAAIAEAEGEAAAHEAALAGLKADAAAQGGGGVLLPPATTPTTPPAALLAAARAGAARAAKLASAAAADAAAAATELEAARAEAGALTALEDAFWRDLNVTEAAAAAVADGRAASAARLARSRAALAALRGRDAVADLYHIWHDGPFGTICGLRLGRGAVPKAGNGEAATTTTTSSAGPAPAPAPPALPAPSSTAGPPGWDEVNGALSAAARLLATLAALHGVRFSRVALLPGGGGARVQELRRPPPGASGGGGGGGTITRPAGPGTGPASAAFDPPLLPPASPSPLPPPLDLGGPANRLYCPAFDRAVSLFAGAVAEFGAAAGLADEAGGVAPPFKLPYAIAAAPVEGGGAPGAASGSVHGAAAAAPQPAAAPPGTPAATVGGVPLRFALAPASRWTRAMKYLLTDLKWCAAWSAERRAGLGGAGVG